MRMRRGLAVVVVVGLGVVLVGLSASAVAQGTKQWTVSRYDEMEQGTTEGVAIRGDGRLEAGPATSLLYETGGNYVWSVATDAAGNTYVGMGGVAAGGAVVMRVAPDGKAAKVFEGKELGVQAVRVGGDGRVYVVTSPDGKVYRLGAGAGTGATTADATVVFDPALTVEKPKYLWDVVQAGSDIYVAAGAPAVVYRLPAGGGNAEVAFQTADQHIRCLLMAPDGATLWAGSDGSGVTYKFDTKRAGAKPFAVYSAAKKEITALAMDGAGNVYAAGVGAKPAPGTVGTQPGLPPLPVTGAVGVTITFAQPGSANAATANTLIPEGSEIYRIAPDGSPEKLAALKDDVVYALAVHAGSLLAATGNRGRVYRVEIGGAGGDAGRLTDVAHLEASQGMAFASVKDGVLVATSNSGKVFRLEDKAAANATYTSEVFDADVFSKWGRVEVRPEVAAGTDAGFDLFVRNGNVQSPLMGWSEWTPVSAQGEVTVPSGRFAQWKAVLRAGGEIDSVGLNYLEKNLAPVVDDVVVQPGARVQASAIQQANSTVQVSFPAPANAAGVQMFTPDANAQPLMAQKDKTAVTVRWAAHDANGDDLIYSVWYRGMGERNWLLLKDKVSDKFLSFDSELLPDGNYEAKVVASDAPDHTEADALTGERVSDDFVVDTTPPVPGVLTAALVPGAAGAGAIQKIHATFSAKDAISPIAHAEYSVDAGPWQYLEPVGGVSDSLEERYDFIAAVPAANATEQVTDAREHVLAVRVYDRYENVVSVKTAVR